MKVKIFSIAVVVVLVLSACTLPFGRQAAPAPVGQPTGQPAVGPGATLPPVPELVQEPAPGTTLRWYDGSLLVYVPSGKFIMGHNGPDNPEHEVFLGGFWIYRTKVTNGMYALCVQAGKCTPPGPDATLPDYTDPRLKDRPVVGVRWAQAEEYCRFMEGRLPTEAEWEKTARGPSGKLYPWGDAQPACNLANFGNCVGHLSNVLNYSEGRSEYDAFDLAGNAFEWVADWYDPVYYSQSPAENPRGPDVGNVRSVRGSAFSSGAEQLRPSFRYFLEPEKYRPDLGFRCVIEDPLKYAPPCEVTPLVGDPGGSPDGGTPGGFGPTCTPPPLDVSIATYCQKKVPYANVDIHDAVNVDLGGASCTNASGSLYVCTGSNNQTYNMSACTQCKPPMGGLDIDKVDCPPGYEHQDDPCVCVYNGGPSGGTECPPPFWAALFIPEQQCCAPELPNPANLEPSCPPGYVLDPDHCACVGGNAEDVVGETLSCQEFTVSLPDCTGGSRTCSGCRCYTNEKDCFAHSNDGCRWDGSVCRGP